MNKKLVAATTLAVMFALPFAAMAFNAGPPPATNAGLSIGSVIDLVVGFIWPVIMIAVIILYTIAAFMFFTAQGNPEKVNDARQAVIWAVAGTVVLFLAWSIPFIVRNTLGV